MSLRELAARLKQYEEQEARSIVRLLLYDCCGMTMTDICCGALEHLNDADTARLDNYMLRLEQGEPVQYVTGKTVFCDREFHVEPGVLIPRTETEELCEMIVHDTVATNHDINIIDIGTGSGCIAVTLALQLPNAHVTAWDISNDALRIAQANATRLGADVKFEKNDVLDSTLQSNTANYDIIVSNPPYICSREAEEMQPNVLDHEPHLALFVPDDDPLLFYRAITQLAAKTLKSSGRLYFEINPLYADEMRSLMSSYMFTDIALHNDQYGRKRFIAATKPRQC